MLYESTYYGVAGLGDDSLQHHGIKGQKWGVRRFQNSDGSLTADGRERYRTTGHGGLAVSDKARSKSVDTIGAIDPVTASIIARLSAVALYSIGMGIKVGLARRKELKIIEERKKDDVGDIQKKIKGKHSPEADQEAVNPGFEKNVPGSRNNCTMCTAAYDLRRRGYDVEARLTPKGRQDADVISWYKANPKKDLIRCKNFKDFKNKLSEQPEGARGNVLVGVGDFDSGHSMCWEKVGGKVLIRDAQEHKTYNSIDESIIRKRSSHPYRFIRTDNLEINWDNIRDAVKERGK